MFANWTPQPAQAGAPSPVIAPFGRVAALSPGDWEVGTVDGVGGAHEFSRCVR